MSGITEILASPPYRMFGIAVGSVSGLAIASTLVRLIEDVEAIWRPVHPLGGYVLAAVLGSYVVVGAVAGAIASSFWSDDPTGSH